MLPTMPMVDRHVSAYVHTRAGLQRPPMQSVPAVDCLVYLGKRSLLLFAVVNCLLVGSYSSTWRKVANLNAAQAVVVLVPWASTPNFQGPVLLTAQPLSGTNPCPIIPTPYLFQRKSRHDLDLVSCLVLLCSQTHFPHQTKPIPTLVRSIAFAPRPTARKSRKMAQQEHQRPSEAIK